MAVPADIDRMLHPQEARDIIAAHVSHVETEAIPVTESAGRIAAQDIHAVEPHPPFPASTMDGFAVLAADASPWREVIGTQNAGDVLDLEVTEGYAIRIMTGAPLPPGADAVVPIEATEPADDHVVILQEDVAPGQNIRPLGVDIAVSDLLVSRGSAIGPAELALLASQGITPVPVYRKLRIAIMSTGDELRDPDEPIAPGQIRDSNRFALRAALAAEPVEITWIGKAPDDRDALGALLRERIAVDDVILTSGGVSMGDKDYIKAILAESDDITVHFRRLFMKPGKPLTFAQTDRATIFGLPGNPVSSMVTFDIFVRPAMRQMMGSREIHPPSIPVALADPATPSDRIEYQRAIVSAGADGRLIGAPTGDQRSSRVASFLGANAYLVIPPREMPYEAGDIVQALLWEAPRSGRTE